MTVFMALPDALIALWLKFLADGLHSEHDRTQIMIAAFGLAASATATWFLRVVFTRVQRRFRDKISVALEAHVATLQASVATIEHHERPEYLDRLVGAARPGVRARPPLHVAVLDAWAGSCASSSRCCCSWR